MIDKRPNFSVDEVKNIIIELYNINGVISSLPSERDQNFLIITEFKEKFILKIANQYEKLEDLELQNKILNHFSNLSSFNHPKLINRRDKSLFQYKKGENE